VTADAFRRIALGLQNTVEGAHMGHPDFRVNGRIFATLHTDLKTGMVRLTPDEQHGFVRAHPATFAPENGAWGRQGCTRVQLDAADSEIVGEAMTLAWRSGAAKQVPRRADIQKPARPRTRSRERP
jgi:hypothetical protein